MKKLLTLLALVSASSLGFAQNQAGQSVVTLNVGYSIIGNLFTSSLNALEGASDANADVSSIPVIIGAFDYGLSDKFSIGIFGGFQRSSGTFDYTYTPFNDSVPTTESVTLSGSRTSIAIRPNFHYGNNDNLDLYSGVRVGFLMRNFTTNSTDDDFPSFDIFDGNRFTLGLTLFGMRYYVTDNIGLGMEIGIGPPYAVNGGVNFRF